MTIRSTAIRTARRLAPNLTEHVRKHWLCRQASLLRGQLAAAASIQERVRAARACRRLRPNQLPTEIAQLLERVSALRPSALCEIGVEKGGTLALFASVAAPQATIISIDLNYPSVRLKACRRLAQAEQVLHCIEADSHATVTRDHVKQLLAGKPLDFLFVDGDHSYDGVKRDFEMYAPLVRRGGLVAFHDIVPDSKTRYGIDNGSDAGEVPRFWKELKVRFPTAAEIIADPEQDGYGIGMIEQWPGLP